MYHRLKYQSINYFDLSNLISRHATFANNSQSACSTLD